ncbi:MAG TPA: hypothetical protein PKK07_02460, partial [bacterium]|nr:hypothetical protein [bacterium]
HVESSVKVETFQMQEDMYLSNLVYDYVVDDTLGDLVKVEVTYYDVFTEDVVIESYEEPNYIHITTKMKQSVNLGQLYEILIEDLKNKRLSNYTALGQYKFKVYASEENIGKLQRNLENQINMYTAPTIEEGVN